jgi:RNA polymerase sigma-70 factor (ECF subfamily)
MTVEFAIAELTRGSETAFTFLFQRYSEEVYNFIYRFIRNKETSRELTQDVFMKLWVHHTSIDRSQSFEGYLFSIARNHLFNFLKRRLKEQEILHQITATATEEDPYDAHTYREVMLQYTHSVASLPPRQRQVFILNREEGLTYKQIAAQLGISVSAVEKHMSAALHTLRGSIYSSPLFIITLLSVLY